MAKYPGVTIGQMAGRVKKNKSKKETNKFLGFIENILVRRFRTKSGMTNGIKLDLLCIVLIFLISFPAVKSLLQPGFFQTHDGDWHIAHVYWFDKALRQGHFPVRWVDEINRGRGYPFFNFYYPLLYYLSEIPFFLGIGLTNSLKIVLVLSFPFSGVATFLWLKSLWGRRAGLVGAVLIMYAPYRFVGVYVSARLGETVAFVFMPLALWGITRLKQTGRKQFLALAGMFWGLLILAHNIQALVFSPFLLAYTIVDKRMSWKQVVLLLGIALGTSAYFWLPAIVEKVWTLQGHQVAYDFADNFPPVKAYFYQPWGYDLNTTGHVGGVSLQLGLAQWGALGMSVFWIRKKNYLPLLLLIWAGMTFLLMNKIALPLWSVLPLLPQIQIPSRLLGMMTFLTPALGGWVAQKHKFIALGLVFLALYSNRNYLRPGYFDRYHDDYYVNNLEFLYGTTDPYGENMPIWTRYSIYTFFKDKIVSDPRSPEIVKISTVVNLPRHYSFIAEVERYGWVMIKSMYYPGWQVKLDGKPYRFQFEQSYGQEEWANLVIAIPSGKHQIEASWEETVFRKTANAISVIAWVGALVYLVPNKRYKIRG